MFVLDLLLSSYPRLVVSSGPFEKASEIWPRDPCPTGGAERACPAGRRPQVPSQTPHSGGLSSLDPMPTTAWPSLRGAAHAPSSPRALVARGGPRHQSALRPGLATATARLRTGHPRRRHLHGSRHHAAGPHIP